MSTAKIIKDEYVYYKDRKLPNIPDDILDSIKGIVYTVTNKKNNKIYVGQTLSHNYFQENDSWIKTGLKDRMRRHINDAKSNAKESVFYNDILEYGEENFEAEVYKIIPIKEIHKLNVEEFNAINELGSLQPKGYNRDKWKNSMCFTKYIFLKYFNLEDKIPSLNINKSSRERCQQKCIVQHSILTELANKELEKVEVVLINSRGNPDQIRIVVKIKDEFDKRRTSWYISKDPLNIIKHVIDIAKELKSDAYIDPRITTILEHNNLNAITYKYQKRLDEALKHEYIKVSGLKIYYSSKNFYSYLLTFSRQNQKDIRYSFGGKTIDIKEAFKDAEEFINKITQVKNISNIILRKPDLLSCPQQQATTKVANIIFVDE